MLLAYVVFFLLVLWLGISVEVDVNRITILPPSPLLIFFSLPTILSLTQVTVILTQRAPKAGFGRVPFSSLVLYIGHLEKSFPESIM